MKKILPSYLSKITGGVTIIRGFGADGRLDTEMFGIEDTTGRDINIKNDNKGYMYISNGSSSALFSPNQKLLEQNGEIVFNPMNRTLKMK